MIILKPRIKQRKLLLIKFNFKPRKAIIDRKERVIVPTNTTQVKLDHKDNIEFITRYMQGLDYSTVDTIQIHNFLLFPNNRKIKVNVLLDLVSKFDLLVIDENKRIYHSSKTNKFTNMWKNQEFDEASIYC